MQALILVDIQNDFLPGGALAVPRGDEVIAVANRVSPKFELVVATRDWHPPAHGSFAAQHPGRRVGDVIELNGLRQTLWPVHCVQNTNGAELAPGLDVSRLAPTIEKGSDPGVDSYSGFFDNGRRNATGLDAFLKARGVRQVYVLGLATDYCVKFTALDAASMGYETFVIKDGCRGVELHTGDIRRALDEMRAAGVKIVRSSEVGV